MFDMGRHYTHEPIKNQRKCPCKQTNFRGEFTGMRYSTPVRWLVVMFDIFADMLRTVDKITAGIHMTAENQFIIQFVDDHQIA